MELSCLSSPTARILSSLHGKNTPFNISNRRSQYQIPPFSTNPSCSNLAYQPNINFLKSASQIYYGRKSIVPLLKVVPDQNGVHTTGSLVNKVFKFPDVLLRFMLPYIVFSTVVTLTSVMARDWLKHAHLFRLPKWILLLRTATLLIGLLCPVGFTNGINQIYDIEIDKINKPRYPLVTGELSLQSAWILVISFEVIGIAISLLLKSGSLLTFVLCHSVMGILYSVPPFSLKRSTLGAMLTCSLAQIVFVISLSVAARTISGIPFQFSTPLIFMTIFTSLFTVGMISLKDIYDMEGDKKFNVPTFASIYGPRKIALFSFGFILLNYVGAIVTAILMPQVFRRSVMIPAHIVLLLRVIFQAWKLEKANYNREVSQSVYQSMWQLFGAEFIIYPFI